MGNGNPESIEEALRRYEAGRMAECEDLCRAILLRRPHDSAASNLLGVTLIQRGELATAVELLEDAVRSAPGETAYRSNLAHALGDLGRIEEAEAQYRALADALPDSAPAHHNHGVILNQLGRSAEAQARFRRASELGPDNAETHHGLAVSLSRLGRYEEAAASQSRVVQLRPEDADAHGNLGNYLSRLGRHQEALRSLERAVALRPEDAGLRVNLGIAQADLHRYSEARDSYLKAIELQPELAEAHNNLGNALVALGQHDAARTCYVRAMELKPDFHDAHTNLIFLMDFLPRTTVAEMQAERRRWADRHAAVHRASRRPHTNRRDPERPLRVGYVSADFCNHSACLIFGPVIRRHQRPTFEVFCYSETVKEDTHTALVKACADRWCRSAGMTDDALAERIRADRIDILVDLSGHSAGNRLHVFARKPAPVQVHAWGHVTGTGLEAIDYLLADPVLIPAEDRKHYAEQIFDLPCWACLEEPEGLPAPSPLPAASRGFVTYSSMNRSEKLTAATLSAWARILTAVPGARLLFKDRALDEAKTRIELLQRLERVGIAPARVTLLGGTSRAEHVAVYQGIDIALDPFPQGGGVTTAEALWMGVPTVTIAGAVPPSRGTAALMSALGLREWVARDEQEYVRVATRAAGNLDELATLRASLRERLGRSPVGNPELYCRAVEAAYRTMWRRWCALE